MNDGFERSREMFPSIVKSSSVLHLRLRVTTSTTFPAAKVQSRLLPYSYPNDLPFPTLTIGGAFLVLSVLSEKSQVFVSNVKVPIKLCSIFGIREHVQAIRLPH